MYVSRVQRGIGPKKVPLTCVSAESEEASRALAIRVCWGVCDFWSAELIPLKFPKNWRSTVERQGGPYEWSLLFSWEPSFVARRPRAKCTEMG